MKMIKINRIMTVAAVAAIILVGILAIGFDYRGAEAQNSTSSYTEHKDPGVVTDGGSGILSLGDTTSQDIEVACWAGQDYSNFDNDTGVNKLAIGNAWGKVTSGGTRSVSADAYFDGGSGDCADGEYAGAVDDQFYLELYLAHVVSIDYSSDYAGYFRYYIENVKEYTSTDCTGSYSSLATVYSSTDTYYSPSAPDGAVGVTTWKQADFDSDGGVYRIPVTYGSPKSGYRSYSYRVRAKVCLYSNWTTCTETYDDGCFYVYWV
jgi:hypothetical protein